LLTRSWCLMSFMTHPNMQIIGQSYRISLPEWGNVVWGNLNPWNMVRDSWVLMLRYTIYLIWAVIAFQLRIIRYWEVGQLRLGELWLPFKAEI
jgi:hypothetical protein